MKHTEVSRVRGASVVAAAAGAAPSSQRQLIYEFMNAVVVLVGTCFRSLNFMIRNYSPADFSNELLFVKNADLLRAKVHT